MSQIYELVVFSAGIKDYTTRVLSIIDPQKRISHVLIREHCTVLNNSYFLKNLSLLGRSLKHTILIDVLLLGFRIIRWLECCNLKIFIKLSLFMETAMIVNF